MIYLGKLLKKDDITIAFYADDIDSAGIAIDPFLVTYTIFDCTHGKSEVIRQTINSVPMRYDTGKYFVPLKIDPQVFRVGRHKIEWVYKRFEDYPLQTSLGEFDIVRDASYSGEFCRSVYAQLSVNICPDKVMR